MNDDHDPTTAEVYAALRRQVDRQTDVDRSLMDLHERVGRRRRLATTGIAAALVAVVAGGALALTMLGPDVADPAGTTPSPTAPVTSDPAEDRCGPPTVSVYLEPLATPEQIQGVRDQLDTLALEPYEFLDRDAVYQEFQRLFADQPDFIGSVSMDQLPEAFRITAEVSAEEFAGLETLPGVLRVEAGPECPEAYGTQDVVEDRCGSPLTFVYLQLDATAQQIDGIRDELTALGLEPYEYFDRDASYQEFQRLFADQPDLIDSVSPDQLPESFRITSETTIEDIGLLETLPGVLRVEPAPSCPPDGGPSDVGQTTTSIVGGD